MAEQKDLAIEAAKMVVKQAVQKALVSASVAVAPYVGVGCLIVLGVFLLVLAVCIIFLIVIYATCNEAPTTIKFMSYIANIVPGISGMQEASMLGQICDILKQQ